MLTASLGEFGLEADLARAADTTRRLQAEGEAYEAAGQYSEAERCFNELIAFLQARRFAEDDDFASLLNELAAVRDYGARWVIEPTFSDFNLFRL